MNDAHLLDLARRTVAACPDWHLPGMLTTPDEDGLQWRIAGGTSGAVLLGNWVALQPLPDFSDDLTRLGVMALVRRELGDSLAYVSAEDALSGQWNIYTPKSGGDWYSQGPTELDACVVALEVAAAAKGKA